MADPNVKITFAGNAAEAERVIARLEQKLGALENKVRRTNSVARQGTGVATGGMDQWIANLGKIALGYAALPALISVATSANRQLVEQTAAINQNLAQQQQYLRVQAGLSQVQGNAAQHRILSLAYESGVSSDIANAAAVQMVSSGFSTQDATGTGLRSVLQLLVASNLGEQDPTETVQALGQFLAATGQEKNAENLTQLARGSQSIFLQDDFQVSDFSQLASKVGGLVGKVSPEEIVAGYSVLRNTTEAHKASTGLKIFAERLMGANGDPTRERELSKMGIQPSDVDFIGENLQTVLDRLGQGFESLPKEQREGTLQRLFGTEASSQANILLAKRGQVQGQLDKYNDVAAFDRSVAAGSSGEAAADRRRKIMSEMIALKKPELSEQKILADELDISLKASNSPAWQRGLSKAALWTGQTFGFRLSDYATEERGIETRRSPDGGLSQAGDFSLEKQILNVLTEIRDESRNSREPRKVERTGGE